MTLNHNGFFLHCIIIKCDFLSRNFAFVTPVQQLDLIVAAQNNAYSSPDTAHHTVYLKIAAGRFFFLLFFNFQDIRVCAALPVLKAASMICIMDGTARKSKLSTEKVQHVPFRCIVYT